MNKEAMYETLHCFESYPCPFLILLKTSEISKMLLWVMLKASNSCFLRSK